MSSALRPVEFHSGPLDRHCHVTTSADPRDFGLLGQERISSCCYQLYTYNSHDSALSGQAAARLSPHTPLAIESWSLLTTLLSLIVLLIGPSLWIRHAATKTAPQESRPMVHAQFLIFSIPGLGPAGPTPTTPAQKRIHAHPPPSRTALREQGGGYGQGTGRGAGYACESCWDSGWT